MNYSSPEDRRWCSQSHLIQLRFLKAIILNVILYVLQMEGMYQKAHGSIREDPAMHKTAAKKTEGKVKRYAR